MSLSPSLLNLLLVALDLRTGMYPRLSASLTCHSASPELTPRRPPFTRSGSVRLREKDVSPEPPEKPSGKRKFKSKHLCDSEEQKKVGGSAAPSQAERKFAFMSSPYLKRNLT